MKKFEVACTNSLRTIYIAVEAMDKHEAMRKATDLQPIGFFTTGAKEK